MRPFLFITIAAIVAAAPMAAHAGAKRQVTVEVSADLLSRAEALDMDLGAFLEKHLTAALQGTTAAHADEAPATHKQILVAAFDNLEAVNFAPLKVNKSTPAGKVKALCQTVRDNRDALLVNAERRRSLPPPEALDEARALDQYRAMRLRKIKTRLGKDGRIIRANAKILERHCPDLRKEDPALKSAFKTVIAKYGPAGWCKAMMAKPQAEWTMNDGNNFARFCAGQMAK